MISDYLVEHGQASFTVASAQPSHISSRRYIVKEQGFSRRRFIRSALTLVGGFGTSAALASCVGAPTAQLVKETVVVEKEVVVTATAAPPVTAGEGPIVLRWLTDHYGGARGQLSDEGMANYKEMKPEVEIVYEPVPEVAQRLMVELAAGQPPDMMLFSDDLMIPYGDKVLDLTPFYEADPEIAREDFMLVPALFLKDNKDWCVPFQGNVQGMWINEDYFKEAGVKMPWEYDHAGDKWWDWNDFLETMKAIRKLPARESGEELYGFQLANRFEWGYLSWVLSNGGNYADVEKGVATFSSEPTKEAMKYLVDMFCEHDVAMPFDRIAATQETTGTFPFAAGLTGAAELCTEGMIKKAEINAYRVGFPRSPRTKEAHTGLNNQPHVISASTKWPQEAFDFIKYMGSREIQWRAQELGAFDPCRIDIYEDPNYYTEWPAVSKEAKLEQIKNGGYRPMFNSFWEWTHEFHGIMEEACDCTLPFEDAIAELDQVTNNILQAH